MTIAQTRSIAEHFPEDHALRNTHTLVNFGSSGDLGDGRSKRRMRGMLMRRNLWILWNEFLTHIGVPRSSE